MMTKYDYDLFVIGGGSAGVRAATLAAGHSFKIGIAESQFFGGTCVNAGCIPKKLLVYASEFQAQFDLAANFGWTVGKSAFNWQSLIAVQNRETLRLQGIYRKRLTDAGVNIFDGSAQLLDAHTVTVNGQNFTSDRILVATGGRPFVPEISGQEHIRTSNDMFLLDELPSSIFIVGGGYIGVEFASIFRGLGVNVTICERGAALLAGFDEDISGFLLNEFTRQGIKILLNADVKVIARKDDAFTVHLTCGREFTTNVVLFATGRSPNSRGFGLETLGVEFDSNDAIVVNRDYQTNIPSVFAIGDVTNRINLTPVAIAEAVAWVNKFFLHRSKQVDWENIPTAVFCHPSVGTVGLTELAAHQKMGEIDVYRSWFTPLKNTVTESKDKTLIKMIVERRTNRVVGLHMVGSDAPEIIQGMAIAMRAGATKAVFDSTLGIHPTAAEEFVTLARH
jgi:glutathione reductase (NADPH)